MEAFHPWALPVLQAAYDCMKSDRRSLFLSSPCSCCASSFRGHQAKHAGECPAILLSRFLSLLLSPGLNHGLRIADRGGDPGGSSGTHSFANLGSQRRNLRDYFWPSDSHAATGQCHPVSDQPAFLKLLQQPTVHTDSTGTVTPGDTQQVSAPRDSGLAATQRKGQRTGGLPDTPQATTARLPQTPWFSRWQLCSSGTRTSSGALSQSTSWVLFAGTAPPLSVPSIAAVATQWNKEQKEAPSKIKAPLRVIMFQCFVQEWRLALERLESDPDFKAEAIRLEILSASGDLPYLRWNSQTMRAEVLTDKSPLTVNEVVLMLKELTVLSIADGTITRFHPTRRFSEDMMGPTVTFRLELGLREVKTFRFWQILETLSANSALRLVASSSRRERMTRSRWPRASHQL